MDRFDPESGQVYRETVIRPDRNGLVEWDRACHGLGTRKYVSPRGADTLTSMILRKLVLHADELAPNVLEAVPATTVQQIRTAIKRDGRESLHIFKCFADSGHGDKTYRFATSTNNFYKPLVNFFQDLNSPKFSWMVDLTLQDVYCSRLDLRQLSTLENLQTLWVSYSKATGEEPFDDSVIDHLSFRASTDNVLSKLAMLFVNNTLGISGQSIGSINRFPALDTFCVVSTSIKTKDIRQLTAFGWYISQDPILQIQPEERSARERYKPATYLSFPERVRQFIQKRRSSATTGSWVLPSVDIVFGSHAYALRSSPDFITGIKCFERDVRTAKNKEASALQSSKRKTIKYHNTSNKDRKVKATKTVDLDKMLDEL